MYGICWQVWFPWWEWEYGFGYNNDIDDDLFNILLDDYHY